jgi:hypothetical protein
MLDMTDAIGEFFSVLFVTEKTSIPAQTEPSSADERELSFRVKKLAYNL